MICDLGKIKKAHPQLYKQLQSKINQFYGESPFQKCQYTFAEKECKYYGVTPINLVLRHSIKQNKEELVLFYQQSAKVISQNFECIPRNQPNKKIKLENVKLAKIVGSNIVNINFSVRNQKMYWINLKFRNAMIAQQWLTLINQKIELAKQLISLQSKTIQRLYQALAKIKNLGRQLTEQRSQKKKALENLNNIKQERDYYKTLCLDEGELIIKLKNDIQILQQKLDQFQESIAQGKPAKELENPNLAKDQQLEEAKQQLYRKSLSKSVLLGNKQEYGRIPGKNDNGTTIAQHYQ